MSTTPEQRAEWRALCERATPGPWRWMDGAHLVTDEGAGPVVLGADEWCLVRRGESGRMEEFEADSPDAVLIAAARTALPALLEDVEALTAALSAARAEGVKEGEERYIERHGSCPHKVARMRAEAAYATLRDALEEMASQHKCGCGHPACKNCQRDEMCARALAAQSKEG